MRLQIAWHIMKRVFERGLPGKACFCLLWHGVDYVVLMRQVQQSSKLKNRARPAGLLSRNAFCYLVLITCSVTHAYNPPDYIGR